uniref:Ribosome biogenesis regulatory protein n=1 Tax=Culicoides sonorensis TaxID=179676 RepID=A0A336M239_CULSO
MDIVQSVLQREQEELAKYKPITVEKKEEVALDLGHLMCTDPNDLDEEQLKNNPDQYLLDLTRDNTQLLLNEIWKLETERVDEEIVAKLPAPKLPLPRSRKLPEPKPLTRWEKFAKEKGIVKRKKDKKVWDEVMGDWVPTWGAKRAKVEKEKDWILEVPKNVDPMTDMFEKKADLKKEKIAKNEVNRLKNIARAEKIQLPRAGIVSADAASSKQLLTAVTIAKASTASVGKFQDKLPKEKEARGIGVKELIPGVKRKKPVGDNKKEREQNLELVTKILNKRPKIDVEKAISVQKREARQERENLEHTNVDSKKGGKKSKGKGKGNKKPKGGRGARKPGKNSSFGRKRR